MTAGSEPPALAVIVLAYNEEANLPACLASLRGLDGAVLVVDSGSTDRTVAIARSYGTTVLTHPFENHASQWRWALAQIDPSHEWVLGLDADQRLTPELRAELSELFRSRRAELSRIDGLYVNRRQIFRGRWIRRGGYYPKYLLKLFRRAAVLIDDLDLIDHHFYVSGPTARLRYDLIEDNQKERDLSFWVEKHVRYARLTAQEEALRRRGGGQWKVRPSFFGSPDQCTVWLKQRSYRMPLYVRAVAYFLYRYVAQCGFLDGRQGFVFHFMQSCWYRVLVDAHLDELLRETSPDQPG